MHAKLKLKIFCQKMKDRKTFGYLKLIVVRTFSSIFTILHLAPDDATSRHLFLYAFCFFLAMFKDFLFNSNHLLVGMCSVEKIDYRKV